MIASRAIAFHATPCGCSACVLAIATTASTWSGIPDRPLERLHPAERAAGDGGEPLDPELVEERALGPHHVRDGDHREVRAVRPSRRGVGRRRSRRSAAAAEQIRGDRRSSDRCRTPCRGRSSRPTSRGPCPRSPSRSSAPKPSRVLSPGGLLEKPAAWASPLSAWQTRITLSRARRERAVGLVGDADRVQFPAAVERHGIRQIEIAASRPLRPSRRARRRGAQSCSPFAGVTDV